MSTSTVSRVNQSQSTHTVCEMRNNLQAVHNMLNYTCTSYSSVCFFMQIMSCHVPLTHAYACAKLAAALRGVAPQPYGQLCTEWKEMPLQIVTMLIVKHQFLDRLMSYHAHSHDCEMQAFLTFTDTTPALPKALTRSPHTHRTHRISPQHSLTFPCFIYHCSMGGTYEGVWGV